MSGFRINMGVSKRKKFLLSFSELFLIGRRKITRSGLTITIIQIKICNHFSTDPPKITSSLQRNVTVRTGEDLELTCQASGVPSPVVTWTRFGRVIKNQTLVLKRVTKSDSGLYLCTAHNKAGDDTKEIIITVRDYNDISQKIPGK